MRNLMVLFFMIAFAAPTLAGGPKVGDTVWAQWKPNAFYHGKIDKTCEWGLHVQFDDGDQGCFRGDLIAVDAPMPAAAVKVGAKVLAKWSDGKLYPATITGKPEGDAVKVFFDDRTPFTTSMKDLRAF